MRGRNRRSTERFRALACLLALLTAGQAAVPASALAGGSLAVLPPLSLLRPPDGGSKDPPASPAPGLWRSCLDPILADPLYPLLDAAELTARLASWDRQARGEEAADAAVALAVRGEVDRLRQEGWERFYRLDLAGAVSAAARAREGLGGVDDPSLAADWLFELSLLEGVCLASLRRPAEEPFLRAARLRPRAVLPPERYSPETIALFERERRKVGEGPRAALAVDATPAGAELSLDGKPAGRAPLLLRELMPGPHFLAAALPGYRPARRMVTLGEWETKEARFDLIPAGPGNDPGSFFAARAAEGDATALRALVEKAGTDRVLLARVAGGELEGEDKLEALLADREGRVTRRWLAGPADLAELLAPARERPGEGEARERSLITLPPVTSPSPAAEEEMKSGGSWWWIVGGLLVAVLAAGASTDGGGSGGTVSVSW